MYLSRRAFTLVELLIVTGIIAVLFGLSLSVIKMVRSSAHTMTCAAKLRELGLATMVYANENRGLLFEAQTNYSHQRLDGNIDPIWGMWPGRVMPYLVKKYDVATAQNDSENWNRYFNCPAGNWTVPEILSLYKRGLATHGISSAWCSSYGYNGGVHSATGGRTRTSTVLNVPATGTMVYAVIRPSAASSSRTILLGEKWGVQENTAPAVPDDRPGVIKPDKLVNYVAPQNWRRQYSHTAGGASAYLRQSHASRGNYLFLDGHVAALAVADTWNGIAHNTTGSLWLGN